jgi:two-component system, LuxR family, sensor kinase FixL
MVPENISAERELTSIREALDRSAIVAITDRAGTIIHVNDKFCQISKYTREELLGQNHRILNSGYHPKEFFIEMWKCISNGKVWEAEIRNRAKDGTFYWVNTTIVPFLDANGKIYQYVSIRYEITQRKIAEEREKIYSSKLLRSNQELQDFASIAAHDLQEPLRKILTFGERLKAKAGTALSDDSRDYLERMMSAAGRMRTLIDDLLSYSRVHSNAKAFAATDLNEVISGVLSDLEVRIEQTHAKVEVSKMPTVDADPSQMRQVFQNVIGNALKFHRPNIPPVVKVNAVESAGICRITISDNGIGFEEKYLDRIFTIFQRLHGKLEYEGTGVGLAVVRRIIERHGGTITATSQPDHGSNFILTLPLRQERTT